MAERCPVCGDVLHPTQDGDYMAVNGCSVCHGKLWTPAELALARATAAKREAELLAELESWRSVASKASAEVITADARVAEAWLMQFEALVQRAVDDRIDDDWLKAARALLDKAGP